VVVRFRATTVAEELEKDGEERKTGPEEDPRVARPEHELRFQDAKPPADRPDVEGALPETGDRESSEEGSRGEDAPDASPGALRSPQPLGHRIDPARVARRPAAGRPTGAAP